jgi:hypothetical protein
VGNENVSESENAGDSIYEDEGRGEGETESQSEEVLGCRQK